MLYLQDPESKCLLEVCTLVPALLCLPLTLLFFFCLFQGCTCSMWRIPG